MPLGPLNLHDCIECITQLSTKVDETFLFFDISIFKIPITQGEQDIQVNNNTKETFLSKLRFVYCYL